MNTRITCTFVGTLARPAQQVRSRYGKLWTRLYCNVPVHREDTTDPAPTWINVAIRGDEGNDYIHLKVGDVISVEGELRLSSYEKNGRPMIGMSITPTSIRVVERQPETPASSNQPCSPLARARVMASAPPHEVLQHQGRAV